MAIVKIPGAYVGRAKEPVEWDVIERIFDAVWGSAWRSLPCHPEVIGGVRAEWWDGKGVLHEAESLDEGGAAYGRYETARIQIYGFGKDLPETTFEFIPSAAEVSFTIVPGPPEAILPLVAAVKTEFPLPPYRPSRDKVFVVHGHDAGARESTARFLERLGLTPVILHEQASAGRTLIEKLEHYGDVDFAIVLLTADDIGGESETELSPRARQNVILELGYFVGRLDRSRVCALCEQGVTLPSDLHGVAYVLLDDVGAWKHELLRELQAAGFDVNSDALV